MLTRLYWPRREAAPTVILLFGQPGAGKTRLVNDKYPIGKVSFRKAPDTKWFDGYDGHKVLLLDDFSGAASKMSLSYTLQLLDRYEIAVEVKGDTVPLLATKIFMTANNHPSTWYKWDKREIQYKALSRRIHYVIGFDGSNPRLLDKSSFFGELSVNNMGDYSSSGCEWSEVPSVFSMPDF
jgi:hypothetical protein